MAFVTKTWKDRVSEYANRRKLVDTSNNETVVTVQRYEGTVTQAGDAFNAANMNNLESRINDAISGLDAVINALATVATSGSYNDLLNKPTIPQGTVTSVRVQATSPVTSSTNTAQTTTLNTTIALANNYGDTKNPYASKNANTFLAAPNGNSGVPSFRAFTVGDLPSYYGDNKNPYNSKTANRVLAAPNGSNGEPSFRALVAADIPALGNITNGGDITTNVAIASGDRIVINDESASKINNSSITFGTSTTTFLSNKGTWLTPSGVFKGADYANIVESWDTGLTEAGATHTISHDGWLRITQSLSHRTFSIDDVQIPRDADVKILYPVKNGQVFKSIPYYGFGNENDFPMKYVIYGTK